MIKSMRKYLLFSSIGDRNSVHFWMSLPQERIFDVVLYYYGDKQPLSVDVEHIEIRKGMKFQNFVHFLDNNEITTYDAIWVVDDDMRMKTKSINRMFTIFSKYDLLLAQPSFSEKGYIAWPITRHDPKCVLRYTNFIENNACVIATEVIPLFMETFKDAGTGFGVDFIWPKLLGYPIDKIAVIDASKCKHRISKSSELDQLVPRKLHRDQGIQLLKKYGLLAKDFKRGDYMPFWKNFPPMIHSEVHKSPWVLFVEKWKSFFSFK